MSAPYQNSPELTTQKFWYKVTTLYAAIDPIMAELQSSPDAVMHAEPRLHEDYSLKLAVKSSAMTSRNMGAQALDQAAKSLPYFYNDSESGLDIGVYDPAVLRVMVGLEIMRVVPNEFAREIGSLLNGRIIFAESLTDIGYDAMVNGSMTKVQSKPTVITEPYHDIDVTQGHLWLGGDNWLYQVPFVDADDHSVRTSTITVVE